MNYIEELAKLNISCKNFSEEELNQIIAFEYQINKLMEFAPLFDQYSRTENKNKFINLDFEHLYAIARIDEKLSKLVFCEFLDIERTLKANILNYKNELNLPDTIISNYIRTDTEYLNKVYTPENRQVLLKYSKPLNELTFEQFLDVVQFGTFQRLNAYIYNTYLNKSFIYESNVSSALRLRNKVAHCENILSQLVIKDNHGSNDVASFLGQKGVNHKTLVTNMSRTIVSDYCNMLFLYCSIEPNYKVQENFRNLNGFINYCRTFSPLFDKNQILVSVFNFMIKVVEIFGSEII